MDLERLKTRLREMTTSQLKGRWKRIADKLRPTLIELGPSALSLETLSEAPALVDDEELRGRVALLLAEPEAELTPEAREERDAARRELGEALVAALLDEESEEASRPLAELTVGHEEMVERARELVLQRRLVALELAARGEQPPELGRAPSAAIAVPVPDSAEVQKTFDKAGELAGKVSRAAGDKIAEVSRKAAGSAAKASSRSVWSMARSAFTYGTKGPEKPPVPVRRRRRRGQDQDSEELLSLIERLHDLRQRGILTPEEFEAKKAELLGRL